MQELSLIKTEIYTMNSLIRAKSISKLRKAGYSGSLYSNSDSFVLEETDEKCYYKDESQAILMILSPNTLKKKMKI